MLTLPGLIDPHVHLRDPGQTEKEDFYTGTCAAIAGGFTTVLDMPNNLIPITSEKQLTIKMQTAKNKIVCDVGFHFGSLGNNFTDFETVKNKVFGLKIYLNRTTGSFIVDLKTFQSVCASWPNSKPILLHAEEDILAKALEIGSQTGQRLHVCHISSESELKIVLNAKVKGYKVTCGATPHHLFLTEIDAQKLGPYGQVKPLLKTQKDVDFLWGNLSNIDVIESDHAPHTRLEKDMRTSPFGLPGLETTLPLLLTAMSQGKISKEEIIRLCYTDPAAIFKIPTDPETKIEIDENEEWTIKNEELFTKCQWSPFNGWRVKGKVKTVFLHGTKVFENGQILAQPGSGRVISN